MQWLLASILLLWGCATNSDTQPEPLTEAAPSLPVQPPVDTLWATNFVYPVGPNCSSKGYYNAQGFGKNTHLGDDWNGTGGGNTDLGDTVYAIANGYITQAEDLYGGWGNVVRIVHFLPKEHELAPDVESLYAHLDEVFATKDNWVKKGEPIGTIGTAHGQYYAHLHLEIRSEAGLPLGGGYSTDTTGYLNPTLFIRNNYY